ncbi:MAG: YjjG family noncanonical pyrimidine nucleotidase [Cytophagales bacterium]
MPKKIKSLFFDLDHTLWDFDLNSELTLKELIIEFDFNNIFNGFNANLFIQLFNEINQELWEKLNQNKITVEELRLKRIQHAVEPFGKLEERLCDSFNDRYLQVCPYKPHLMPKVHETLNDLFQNGYKLYVLTNGFDHIQMTKLVSSGIFHFFENVITFTDTGVRKPDIQFFEFALNICKDEPEQCMMIGDNPVADLSGAQKIDIETVWFNPKKQISHIKPDHEIACISEIVKILN